MNTVALRRCCLIRMVLSIFSTKESIKQTDADHRTAALRTEKSTTRQFFIEFSVPYDTFRRLCAKLNATDTGELPELVELNGKKNRLLEQKWSTTRKYLSDGSLQHLHHWLGDSSWNKELHLWRFSSDGLSEAIISWIGENQSDYYSNNDLEPNLSNWKHLPWHLKIRIANAKMKIKSNAAGAHREPKSRRIGRWLLMNFAELLDLKYLIERTFWGN